ncbi:MAG: excinuclease ABC subunit C [Mycoplasmatales bacterium]|nr:excinuclease ABC subunit C [Mycoplasmatales bacterium]
MNKINLDNVPNKSGIYIWKNSHDEIIYVGKATRLRQRMKQYFKGMLNSYKTATLVEEIVSFDYIITNSDKEALVLERNYIEQYFPKYNILLTDNKRYPYIKISLKDKLDIRLVYRVKSERDKNSEFFGPYPRGYGARKLVNLLLNITMYKKGLPYLTNDRKYWEDQYKIARNILTSGTSKLITDLSKRMIEASENLQYELAQDLKETIESLEFNKDKQLVEFVDNRNVDFVAFYEFEGYISIVMLFYRNGIMLSNKEFIVEITNSLEESTRQFLSQYYSTNVKPEEIISNIMVDSSIPIVVPQIGNNKKVLNLAITNASDNIKLKLEKFMRIEEQTIGAVNKLKELLKLKKIYHILMMDNSNTNNTLPVSVIVSYRNGIKQKKEYRKYNLQKTNRDADVEYMRQGIERYFSKETNAIPDLFIVDGGIAQVNEAKKILADKNINLIGLVKNDLHKTEAIIGLDGKRIEITDVFLLNFLSGMQVEVDRFAKFHHAGRRINKTLEGSLITIKGVGANTEKKLLSHFKTYSGIYNASLDELEKVVSPKVALKIFQLFEKTK